MGREISTPTFTRAGVCQQAHRGAECAGMKQRGCLHNPTRHSWPQRVLGRRKTRRHRLKETPGRAAPRQRSQGGTRTSHLDESSPCIPCLPLCGICRCAQKAGSPDLRTHCLPTGRAVLATSLPFRLFSCIDRFHREKLRYSRLDFTSLHEFTLWMLGYPTCIATQQKCTKYRCTRTTLTVDPTTVHCCRGMEIPQQTD